MQPEKRRAYINKIISEEAKASIHSITPHGCPTNIGTISVLSVKPEEITMPSLSSLCYNQYLEKSYLTLMVILLQHQEVAQLIWLLVLHQISHERQR